MREVKWDFSDLQRPDGRVKCPGCVAETTGESYAVHPETFVYYCERHQKEFLEWHDEEVAKGNIESWFKGG